MRTLHELFFFFYVLLCQNGSFARTDWPCQIIMMYDGIPDVHETWQDSVCILDHSLCIHKFSLLCTWTWVLDIHHYQWVLVFRCSGLLVRFLLYFSVSSGFCFLNSFFFNWRGLLVMFLLYFLHVLVKKYVCPYCVRKILKLHNVLITRIRFEHWKKKISPSICVWDVVGWMTCAPRREWVKKWWISKRKKKTMIKKKQKTTMYDCECWMRAREGVGGGGGEVELVDYCFGVYDYRFWCVWLLFFGVYWITQYYCVFAWIMS